jgi:hypothetical protein
MYKKLTTYLSKFVLVALAFFLKYQAVLAQPENNSSDMGRLANPLCNDSENCIETLPDFIAKILEIVLLIGVPLVAVAIIYAGFQMVTGAISGKADKVSDAKKMLIGAIIGGAILLGAWVIAEVIGDTVNTFGVAS